MPKDPNELVREVIANEIQKQAQDHSNWQYMESKKEGGEVQLLEIVGTHQGDIHRVIAVNGHPLSVTEARKEDARIHRLVSNRQPLESAYRKEKEDFNNELHLLRMLPDIFVYRYAGEEGSLVKLQFKPNPAFHPSGHEAQVFHEMEGIIWVDPKETRLARMSGRLTREVKFGAGILGYLDAGGTFDVEQQEVANGFWELTRLDVNMNGRMLFFKTISVKQNVENYDYKPVSANITLQQAAELLERGSTAALRERSQHTARM